MAGSGKRIGWAWILLICVAVTCLASGCASRGTPKVEQNQAKVTVKDAVGRVVAVPADPQRIACLCPESGHAMAIFGQGDKIVAAVGGMQRDLVLVEMYPHIKEVPVPKTSGAINIEELARCKPDLVFVKGDTANNQAEVDKLNKSGIPFLVIKFNSMEEQQQCMAMIGEVLGEREIAAKYIQYYRRILERVAEQVGSIPESERVRVYHSLNEATRTDAPGTLPADWTRWAGADNVSVDQELKPYEGNYYASMEQILLWDPEVILVNDPNVVDYIMNHEQWKPIKAVRDRRVLALPNGLSRWGHFSSLETPLAVMWTAKNLYPEQFAAWDMDAETRYFYREFLRMELSDQELEGILTAKGMRAPKGDEPE